MINRIALILFIGMAWGQVTVDGYAYLENQAEHDSIQVLFERIAPSSLYYTTYTASDGSYSIQIESGIYDIGYSKDGFDEDSLMGQTLYANTTLPDITLLEYMHMTLINVPSDYPTIQEAIDNSLDGDTVLVAAGTYVENVNYNGKNIVVGSLFLTTQDTTYISATIIDGNQNGSVVRFESGENSMAVLIGFTLQNGSGQGGGIYFWGSDPTLTHVTISDNTASYRGGGMGLWYSNPTLTHVTINGNTSNYGGGIYSDSSSPSLENVTITGNTAGAFGGGMYLIVTNYGYSTPTLTNVTFSGNTAGAFGGGMFLREWCNPTLTNVTFSGNTAEDGGGMAFFYGSSSPTLTDVTFSDNSAIDDGGGIYCNDSNPSLENVTIVGNSAEDDGGGMFLDYDSSPSLMNTIVSDNTGNYNIYVESGNPSITYSDLYNNGNGNCYNCGDWVGVNVTTNVNGDSCDAYFNIQADPLFVDPENGDYHLTENSPCIDAGDPNLPLDPDSTLADMGAFYFDQSAVGFDEDLIILPNKFYLYQNHPNPFNPVTTLQYDLPEDAMVNVTIYDMMGRVVKTMVNSQQNAGYKSIQWNATNNAGQAVSAGLYLYTIQAGDFRQTKKMVLLK
jgi:predicted outer membrane repeat protein